MEKTEKFDPLKLENQLCFPLYAAARDVVNRYRPFLSEIGLTYTQYITMMLVWEFETVDARTLGQRLFLDSGTLTPVLKSLEAKGLVTRRRCEKDSRHLIVSITPAGRALRQKAEDIPQKIASCLALAPKDAEELYRLLYRLLSDAKPAEEETAGEGTF